VVQSDERRQPEYTIFAGVIGWKRNSRRGETLAGLD
jgi:hypothetical protein